MLATGSLSTIGGRILDRVPRGYLVLGAAPLISAGRHIAAVAAALSPDVIAAAQGRGRARDLDTTVAQLLAELGEQKVGDSSP